MRSLHYALAWLLCLGMAQISWADESAGKDKPKQDKKVSSEEINRLVEQLGDDDFTKRTEARKKLEAIGEPAVSALKKAVETATDVEIRSAAKAILEVFDKKNSGLVRSFEGHGERVNGVAISSDGKRALSACWDGVLRYWNLENGELVREMGRRTAVLNSVALAPDGKRALTSSADRSMYLWDLESGKMLRAFQGHNNTLWDVAYSPDGKKALSGSSDGTARLWEVDSGKELRVIDAQKGGRVWTVAFTADGKQAITGSGNLLDRQPRTEGYLRLWDLATGKEVRQFKGHDAPVGHRIGQGNSTLRRSRPLR